MEVLQVGLWHEPDGKSVGVIVDTKNSSIGLFKDRTKRVLNPFLSELAIEHEVVIVKNHTIPETEVRALDLKHFSNQTPLFWHQDDADGGDAVVLHKPANTPDRMGETWFKSLALVETFIQENRQQISQKFPELMQASTFNLEQVYTAILENNDPDNDEFITDLIWAMQEGAYRQQWTADIAQTTITRTNAHTKGLSCHARIANPEVTTDAPILWNFADLD